MSEIIVRLLISPIVLSLTFRIFYYFWYFALHHRDSRICSSKIDANNLALDLLLTSICGLKPSICIWDGCAESM